MGPEHGLHNFATPEGHTGGASQGECRRPHQIVGISILVEFPGGRFDFRQRDLLNFHMLDSIHAGIDTGWKRDQETRLGAGRDDKLLLDVFPAESGGEAALDNLSRKPVVVLGTGRALHQDIQFQQAPFLDLLGTVHHHLPEHS